MNSRYLLLVFSGLLLITSGCNSKKQATFTCDTGELNGKTVPATVVNNPAIDRPLTVIYFDPQNSYFGSEWTPQARCEEISRRFQAIYDRDSLGYITVDKAQWITEQEVDVVCSTKKQKVRCEEDDLLFTLQTEDDPNEVLDDLMAFREAPSENEALTRSDDGATFEEGKRVFYDFAGTLDRELKSTSTSPKDSAF